VDSAGVEGNNASTAPSTSSDGRHVAFESFATNLVAGGGDAFQDIYVHDRQIGITTRVSVDSFGVEGNNASTSPSISSNGRHVAFESFATNLVAAGGDAFQDIYVHDRDFDGNGTYDEAGGVSTVRVSVDSVGNEQIGESLFPSISGDGRYVAFQSNADLVVDDILGFLDIYVHDRDFDGNGTYDEAGGIITVRVSEDSAGNEATAASSSPSISADGRYVAFESVADLVVDDTLGFLDIYVHDRDFDGNGTYDEAGGIITVRVSVHSDGTEGNEASGAPSISADGRYVAFESLSTNLVAPATNGNVHIFVRDLLAGTTTLVSVDSTGAEGDNNSNFPSISDDGRYVAFESLSTNLVVGDTLGFSDVFVHDRDADGNGTYDELGAISTTRVSVDLDGVEGNGNSNAPSMSADGKSVTFQSDADNLVAGDMPFPFGFPDIFVDDLQTGAGGGGGSDSGDGGCFIATAAFESRMAGEK
jgi:Tol biopolymer transport system component